jgi:hypothetical protein
MTGRQSDERPPFAIILYDEEIRLIEAQVVLDGGASIRQSFVCSKAAMAECLAEVAVRLAADYELDSDRIQLQSVSLKQSDPKKRRAAKK